MNCSIYIFGDLNGVYSQYPNDYTNDIFKRFISETKSQTQVAIHRDGDLVYMGYTRRLKDAKDSNIFGICLLLNNCVYKDITQLYTIFDDAFTSVVVTGKLLEFNSNGDVIPCLDYIHQQKDEIERVSNVISYNVNRNQTLFVNIPPLNYAAGSGDFLSIAIDDGINRVVNAIASVNNIYFYHKSNANIFSLSSYTTKLRNLNSHNNELKEEIRKLQDKNETISNQKKQYKLVVWLMLILSICVIGLLAFNSNVMLLKSDIQSLTNQNDSYSQDIDSLSRLYENNKKTISDLTNRVNVAVIEKDKFKEKLSKLEEQFGSTYPLIITDVKIGNSYKNGDIETSYGSIIYSSRTMFLKPKIYYTGIIDATKTLKVKWFKPDGSMSVGDSSPSGYSQSNTITIYDGENSNELTGWGNENKGYWKAGSYRIEIWYNDVCLKAKTFKIN